MVYFHTTSSHLIPFQSANPQYESLNSNELELQEGFFKVYSVANLKSKNSITTISARAGWNLVIKFSVHRIALGSTYWSCLETQVGPTQEHILNALVQCIWFLLLLYQMATHLVA